MHKDGQSMNNSSIFGPSQMFLIQGLLHQASREGDLAVIGECLSSGIDVNGKDKHKRTALHIASWAGQTEAVRALLSAPGVRVKEPAVDNMTALHFAAQNGHAEVCRMLITAGVPVNIKNKKGITALHFACVKGHPETIKLLLKRKAGPFISDKKGLNAVDKCTDESCRAIVQASMDAETAADPFNKKRKAANSDKLPGDAKASTPAAATQAAEGEEEEDEEDDDDYAIPLRKRQQAQPAASRAAPPPPAASASQGGPTSQSVPGTGAQDAPSRTGGPQSTAAPAAADNRNSTADVDRAAQGAAASDEAAAKAALPGLKSDAQPPGGSSPAEQVEEAGVTATDGGGSEGGKGKPGSAPVTAGGPPAVARGPGGAAVRPPVARGPGR